MKLLYITNGINGSGGLERVLSIKATYLADRLGYDVHVLTLNGGHKDTFYDFSKRIAFHDIEVAGNPIWNLFSYWRGIKQIVRALEPDVVLVCDDGFKGLMFPLIFGRRVPLVYEGHAAKVLNISSRSNSVGDKIISSMVNHSSRKFNSFVVLTNGNKKDWPSVSC